MDEILNIIYENDLVKKKIKNIKLYNQMFKILDQDHLNNFIIYANDFGPSGIKLSIFFKINEINLLFIESFFLDCCYPLKNILNWQNFNHTDFNNFENLSDMDFKLVYKLILTDNGTLNLELIKGNVIEMNNEVIIKTSKKTDGFYINQNDFNFQIIIWELFQNNYQNLRVSKIHTKYFKNVNTGENHIFYKHLYDESIYLRHMIKKQCLFCDKCKKEIHNFNQKSKVQNHWEYKGILHLCNRCYLKKVEKEKIRKEYIKRKILLEGKKIVFQKKLKEIKELKLDIKEVNNFKFYKKIIHSLINDMNKNNKNKICSICYDHYLDKKLAVGNCGHVFHLECVKSLTSCPICREPEPNFRELYF